MNYHLDGLNKEDAKDYIYHKLKGANCHTNIFSEGALEGIINTSNGVARKINKICNACLLIGHTQNQGEINNDLVIKAVNEIELG
jgi:type II secretory pathway predicted ATPase ExeA